MKSEADQANTIQVSGGSLARSFALKLLSADWLRVQHGRWMTVREFSQEEGAAARTSNAADSDSGGGGRALV